MWNVWAIAIRHFLHWLCNSCLVIQCSLCSGNSCCKLKLFINIVTRIRDQLSDNKTSDQRKEAEVWGFRAAELSALRLSACLRMASSLFELRGSRIVKTEGSEWDGAVLLNAQLLNQSRHIQKGPEWGLEGYWSVRERSTKCLMQNGGEAIGDGRQKGGRRLMKGWEDGRRVIERWKRMGKQQ